MTALLAEPTPPSSTAGPSRTARITFDDYLAMTHDEGLSHELVDGILEEIHVSALSSTVAMELGWKVRSHTAPSDCGRIFNAEKIYRCFPWKPDNARKPDVSFVLTSRLPDDWTTLGYFTIPPDLFAEVLSPNDLVYHVNEKLFEYLRSGVRLVWIIDPEQRVVFVHRLNGSSETLRESDELSGEDVIPGFRCRVADLFPERRGSIDSAPSGASPASA